MPKPRERDPSDKIKGKGKNGGRPVRDVRRRMTAKLRKELVEQKRAGQEPPADVQAVDQVEQTGAAAFDKVSDEAGRLIDRALHPDRQPKERTEAIKGDGRRPQERQPRTKQAEGGVAQFQSQGAPLARLGQRPGRWKPAQFPILPPENLTRRPHPRSG